MQDIGYDDNCMTTKIDTIADNVVIAEIKIIMEYGCDDDCCYDNNC